VKSSLPIFFAVACAATALGDDVYYKADGKVLRGLTLRRQENLVFGKSIVPSAASDEMQIIAVQQIERIAFTEPAALLEARKAALAGDALAALEKASSVAQEHRPWADIPGNLWREAIRIQIASMLALQRDPELRALCQNWIPTEDLELEETVRLLSLQTSPMEKETIQSAYQKAVALNPGSLPAVVSYLAMGKSALESRQWKAATKAFLSVPIFAPHWKVLHPPALLGVVRAFLGDGQRPLAARYAEDLKSDFPHAPENSIAETLLTQAP
jgi:hypothetical protein